MPESGIIKHNYLFCQFVNPAQGHEGDRCDCFDSPSQRRTRLAKQRLARLQADRSINRASTSGNEESAVASDLVVTKPLPLYTMAQTRKHPPEPPSHWCITSWLNADLLSSQSLNGFKSNFCNTCSFAA